MHTALVEEYRTALKSAADCMVSRYWQRIHHTDYRALAMADRHYSRQTPGSREFTRPGNKVVLMHFDSEGRPAALWASQRPDPTSGVTRADGRDVWDCPMFRVERRTVLASDLIREAVGITLGLWGDDLPGDGFYTTVKPDAVRPILRRGKPVYGWCFQKAGFHQLDTLTKNRHLVQMLMPTSTILAIGPMTARWNAPLFDGGTYGNLELDRAGQA